WRGLLLASAVGQLGGRLVPLPGGLGGMEGGVLGALALTRTHPAPPPTAGIVYPGARYWAPRALGAAPPALPTPRPPAPACPRGPPRSHPGTGPRARGGRRWPPRRKSCLPPGPEKVTAMYARPGNHAPVARAAGRAASRPDPAPARSARSRPWRDYWQLVPV